jgi:hypothetical protein
MKFLNAANESTEAPQMRPNSALKGKKASPLANYLPARRLLSLPLLLSPGSPLSANSRAAA